MASLAQRNGNYSVRFSLPDGSRKTVALGTKSKDRAKVFATRIARLNACKRTGDELDGELLLWLNKLSPKLKRRLAAVGLLPEAGRSCQVGRVPCRL